MSSRYLALVSMVVLLSMQPAKQIEAARPGAIRGRVEVRRPAARVERRPGVAELRAVISKYKLAPVDIKAAMKRGKRGSRGIAKGSKLQPKYRNPANKDETWAGRGLKPKWLSSALKKGKKIEDFAV